MKIKSLILFALTPVLFVGCGSAAEKSTADPSAPATPPAAMQKPNGTQGGQAQTMKVGVTAAGSNADSRVGSAMKGK